MCDLCLKFYIYICKLLIAILFGTITMEYLLKSHFPTCQKLFIKQPTEKHCKTENQKDREE